MQIHFECTQSQFYFYTCSLNEPLLFLHPVPFSQCAYLACFLCEGFYLVGNHELILGLVELLMKLNSNSTSLWLLLNPLDPHVAPFAMDSKLRTLAWFWISYYQPIISLNILFESSCVMRCFTNTDCLLVCLFFGNGRVCSSFFYKLVSV